MMGAYKKSVLVAVFFVLVSGRARATVSVSPVLIEAVQVQVGQEFCIICQNGGQDEIELQLSLALFDQDETGSVLFLEDAEAVQKARDALKLESNQLTIDANGEGVINLKLIKADFNYLYAVLFVKPKQKGVQTRFAVLFLLSTLDSKPEMILSSWVQKDKTLALTIHNEGLRHDSWRGELHFFNAENYLAEKRQINSGMVLAGRSRGVEVALPSWVRRVEVISNSMGQNR